MSPSFLAVKSLIQTIYYFLEYKFKEVFIKMKDTTRQIIIEITSTVAAAAVELWRKVAKDSERKGGKK